MSGEPPITVVAALTPGGAAGGGASAAEGDAPAAPRRVRGPGDNDDLIDFAKVSDVMSTLMAKGFVLGKDALAKAKAREAAPRQAAPQPCLRGFEMRALRCGAQALDEQAGVSSSLKDTASELNSRCVVARGARAAALRRQLRARKPCRTRALAPRATHARAPRYTRMRTHCADARTR